MLAVQKREEGSHLDIEEERGETLIDVRKRNSELLSVLNSLPFAMKKMMRNGK